MWQLRGFNRIQSKNHNIYKILSHEPSLVIQALTGLVSLLYIPFFYAYSTKREFALCGIVLFLCYFGVVIFIQ